MSRQFAKSTVTLSVLAAGLFCGCQKPMGSTASGPFAPAGTLAPTTNQPLIPFGPITGATRVPPPPTGSTRASNSYAAPTTNPTSAALDSTKPYDSFAQTSNGFSNASAPPTAPSPPPASRINSGGMAVIDLTATAMVPQQSQSFQPIGSGLSAPPLDMNTGGGWQTGVVQVSATQQAPSISVPQGDLASRLRPLDTSATIGAVPVAGFSVPPAQPNDNFGAAGQPPSAWQTVQPTPSQQQSPSVAYVSQLPNAPSPVPSTDPINTEGRSSSSGQGGNSEPSNSNLLWRNPAVAR
jgi:hypothetical protein